LLLLRADVSTASQSNPNGSITYDRHSFNAIVPKADLVEYYLPAWEACATEGKAGSIMCSCESHATPRSSTCL
jgi:beta-glucosidase-like glycosyl hydrolase